MAANGISTLATKQAKQAAKLALAQTKYSGKASTGSLLFSGQNDVIYSPTDSATTIMGVPYITSTSTFTAEARIKLTAYQNGPIIGDASGFTMHWSLLVDTRGGAYGKLTFYWYDSSANAYKRVYGNTSLSLDTWYHVAVSISAGAVKLFVDGVLQTATSEQSNNGFTSVTSRAATLTDGPASFGFLTIGSWGNFNSSNSFAGYITNLRISRTARYSTTFTPGTTALTTDANTGLLLLVSSAQYYLDDISGNLFNMRLSGHGVPDWTADTPITVTANTGLPGYRSRSTLDITLLPTQYTGNAVTDNANTGGLRLGRPWATNYQSDGLQVFLQTAPSTGATWTDASGNGNNATIVTTGDGNYVYNSNLGGHITLDGAAGAGLNISGYNLATDGGTYSVEVVASISSTSYWSSLFGNDDFTLNKGVVAYYGNSSNFYISTPTSNGVYAPVSLATRQNINQYIITVTGNTVKFYLNGVSQALTNNTGGSPGFTASSGTPTNGLMIGARHPNAGTAGVPYDSASGSYFLVRVYNTLLSQTDVTANYNAIKTTYGI